MTKKEFALSKIAPYHKDPSKCGYDKNGISCKNITPDGKMCVAGAELLDEVRKLHKAGSISSILYMYNYDQYLNWLIVLVVNGILIL